MPVHKYVEESAESEGYNSRASERKGRRETEDGRCTSFGRREVWRDQARPEARLWLRDYLGRQASGCGGAAGERGIMKGRRGKERA